MALKFSKFLLGSRLLSSDIASHLVAVLGELALLSLHPLVLLIALAEALLVLSPVGLLVLLHPPHSLVLLDLAHFVLLLLTRQLVILLLQRRLHHLVLLLHLRERRLLLLAVQRLLLTQVHPDLLLFRLLALLPHHKVPFSLLHELDLPLVLRSLLPQKRLLPLLNPLLVIVQGLFDLHLL